MTIDKIKHNDIEEKLEALVDKSSVNYVLNNLVQICWGKADHLDTNWQDHNAAIRWKKLAIKLEAFADKNDTL